MPSNIHSSEPKANALAYSIKVWLTGLTAGPLLFILINPDDVSFMALSLVYFYMFFYGVLFSIPSSVMLYVCAKLVNRLRVSLIMLIIKKCILVGAGVVLTIMPFYLFVGNRFNMQIDSDDHIMLCYLITIIAGLLFYRLNPRTQSELEPPQEPRPTSPLDPPVEL